MKPIVIFGHMEFAEIAAHYLANDGGREIAAFTVDGARMDADSYLGKPLVAFEEIEKTFPPDSFEMFVAVGYSGMNSVRAAKCAGAAAKGYDLVTFVHSRAAVAAGVSIGRNCFILENNSIEPFVKIGNHVVIWSGSVVCHHAHILDNVFIASRAAIAGKAIIGENSFIGIGAVIRDRVSVARRCVVGAGALIMENTVENGCYIGNATADACVPPEKLVGRL